MHWSTIVVDLQTKQVHQFATYEDAWFGRGKLEVAHRPAVAAGMKEQRRQERRQAGV